MTVTKIKAKTIQPKIATIILFGIILLGAIISLLWAAGLGQINDIFAYLNSLQEQPPMWVEAPRVMSQYLLIPTILLFLPSFILTRISNEPRTWSRFIVVAILLILTVRYILWRSLSTLNLSNPLDGTFSIGLFA